VRRYGRVDACMTALDMRADHVIITLLLPLSLWRHQYRELDAQGLRALKAQQSVFVEFYAPCTWPLSLTSSIGLIDD